MSPSLCVGVEQECRVCEGIKGPLCKRTTTCDVLGVAGSGVTVVTDTDKPKFSAPEAGSSIASTVSTGPINTSSLASVAAGEGVDAEGMRTLWDDLLLLWRDPTCPCRAGGGGPNGRLGPSPTLLLSAGVYGGGASPIGKSSGFCTV